MIKTVSLLAFLLVTTPAFATPSELTGRTMIDSDVVTVGDLFTNAGGHENHVLAPTPQVGQKLVLSKDDLSRVADAFKLDWHAPETLDVVALERDATLVSVDSIIAALATSELETQVSPNAQFKLNNLSDDVIVAGKTMPELKISNAQFNADREEFTADLELKRGDVLVKKIALQGIATQMIAVPALKFPMAAGNTITDADITEIPMPKNQIRGGMVLATTELVGMTVKRSMLPKQGINRSDVVPPMMVKRNELVTIMYNNGPVALSTKARSLSNGTVGDTIMFMNTNSKKPFTAKVTGPQQAEVNVSI